MYAVETNDRALLRSVLASSPVRAAYMLGDLDPNYVRYTRWFVASDEPDGPIGAVAMLYSGLRIPVVLTYGEARLLRPALSRVLELMPGPAYLQIQQGHDAAVAQLYDVSPLRPLVRMGLTRNTYVRPGTADVDVMRLGHGDTAALMQLYQYYPDAFFEPYQLEGGHYFGVREGDRLLAVAGVHVVSEEFQVAVIGNVVTHPEARGRGLARTCVARQLDELLELVPLVALNVPDDNDSAHRTFGALGFTADCSFLEGLATPLD